MKKQILINLYIMLMLIPGISSGFCAETREVTGEIHENKEVWFRLHYTAKNFSLFLIDETESGIMDNLIFGITSTWISFGPMYRYGLFKEIDNPLGYTPQSAVFFEKSELRLKSSFESGHKRFLYLMLIPGFWHIFYQTGEDVPLFFGTSVKAFAGDMIKTELLFSISEPVEKNDTDSWFSDIYLFPGGTLYHVSTKFLVQIKKLDFSLSGSLSRGDTLIPGFFVHSYVSGCIDRFTFSGIFGYCSEYYTTPGGANKTKMIRTGSSFEYSPGNWFSGELWYYLDIDHPKALPKTHLFTTHNLGGKMKITARTGKENHLDMELHEKSVVSFDEENEKEESHELSLNLGYLKKERELWTALSVSIDETQVLSTKITSEFLLCNETRTFSLQNILYVEEEISWKGKIKYQLHKDKVDVWASFSGKKPLSLTEKGYLLFSDNPFNFICFSIGVKVIN